MGAEVAEVVARFIDERYGAPTSDYSELDEMLATLAAPPPDHGSTSLTALLEKIVAAAGKGFDTASPGFVGYIPGGGLFASALAGFVACAVNRYTGFAAPAPALVQMEASVLRWLCDLFDLGPESQGVLTPGGSMANLSAVVTARAVKLGETFTDGTLYASDQVHHSVAKAARIAGLPADAVRTVPTDATLHMDVDALRDLVRDDRARGRRPFLAVASAGTINTGAIDPLHEIADVAAENGMWFHVDGAYGGFFQLTDRGRARLSGIERADSITLDPHKAMFLPYGTGCLLARDAAHLRTAHELQAHYLPRAGEANLPDFTAFSPELTRDFRGLRLWLPLHLHGADAFAAALDEKLDLADLVHDELATIEALDVPWRPELSTVAFTPRGGDDARARAFVEQINGTGRVFLSAAVFAGRTYLRICIVSHRTRSDRVREAIEIVKREAAALDHL